MVPNFITCHGLHPRFVLFSFILRSRCNLFLFCLFPVMFCSRVSTASLCLQVVFRSRSNVIYCLSFSFYSVACFPSCFALVYLQRRSVLRSCFAYVVTAYFVCLFLFLQYCLFSVMFCSRVPTALLIRKVVFRRSRCNFIFCLCFAVLLCFPVSFFSLNAIVMTWFSFSFSLTFALIFM